MGILMRRNRAKKNGGKIACGFLTCFLAGAALGNQVPQALSTDGRMRVVSYTEDNVIEVQGTQFVQTSLEFGRDEQITDIEGGDAQAWVVSVPKGRQNIVFVKPIVDASNTNLTVLTNAHVYHFHLTTVPKDQEDATYNVRFVYPEDLKKALAVRLQKEATEKDAIINDDMKNPLTWNWDYSFSGKCAKDFVPKKVFDDGEFTYFEFEKHTEVPAIFVVDEAGHESLANWHVKGAYVVLQKVARQFSLRNGKVTTCVFNDDFKA